MKILSTNRYESSKTPICFIFRDIYKDIMEESYGKSISKRCGLRSNNYYAFCSCWLWLINGPKPIPEIDYYFDVSLKEQDNPPEYFLKKYGYT